MSAINLDQVATDHGGNRRCLYNSRDEFGYVRDYAAERVLDSAPALIEEVRQLRERLAALVRAIYPILGDDIALLRPLIAALDAAQVQS